MTEVPHKFTPRQLATFIAAAELANFTLAAGRLNLTPSAVSNLIGELEATLGFALFERTTRQITLTADGRKFLPSALAVQRQLNLAATTAADIRKKSVETVRIGAPLSVAAAILPPLIAAYREESPRVEIRIVDTGVEWLADKVLTGEVDLALGPDRAVGEAIICERLYPTPWVLWCSTSNPVANKKILRWSDLGEIEFFVAGHDHEQSVPPLALKGPHDTKAVPKYIFDNVTTALGMAATGLGVAFSPEYVGVLAKSLGLEMCRIIEPEVLRYMTIYSPSGRDLPQAAEGFRRFIVSRHSKAGELPNSKKQPRWLLMKRVHPLREHR